MWLLVVFLGSLSPLKTWPSLFRKIWPKMKRQDPLGCSLVQLLISCPCLSPILFCFFSPKAKRPTETERCIESLIAIFQKHAGRDGNNTKISKTEFLIFMNTELAAFTQVLVPAPTPKQPLAWNKTLAERLRVKDSSWALWAEWALGDYSTISSSLLWIKCVLKNQSYQTTQQREEWFFFFHLRSEAYEMENRVIEEFSNFIPTPQSL